jgi:hypothetical protein
MQNESDQKGFTIEFEFTPNDYFTNTLLTKSYELRTGPDEHEPSVYEGPEIVKSKGCTIDWKKGKNVTVKMVKKRQKHKNRGTIRVVTKEVQTESFFNFLTPPTGTIDASGLADDRLSLLQFRKILMPRWKTTTKGDSWQPTSKSVTCSEIRSSQRQCSTTPVKLAMKMTTK